MCIRDKWCNIYVRETCKSWCSDVHRVSMDSEESTETPPSLCKSRDCGKIAVTCRYRIASVGCAVCHPHHILRWYPQDAWWVIAVSVLILPLWVWVGGRACRSVSVYCTLNYVLRVITLFCMLDPHWNSGEALNSFNLIDIQHLLALGDIHWHKEASVDAPGIAAWTRLLGLIWAMLLGYPNYCC